MKTQIRNQTVGNPSCSCMEDGLYSTTSKLLKAFGKLQFLALALTTLLVTSFEATAITINVPADQPDIAAAVAAANPGDVIEVAAGVYNIGATIVVNKAVTINGPQANVDPRTAAGLRTPGSVAEAIVDRGGSGIAFSITVAGVVINGLEIRNGSGDLIESTAGAPVKTGVTVSYCIVHNGGDEGIQLRNVDGGGVDHCLVYSVVGDGINMCCGSTNSSVSDNEVTTSASTNGAIYLYNNGPNMMVTDNLLSGNTGNDGIKLGIQGGGDAALVSNAIVSGNTVSGQPQDGISIYTSGVTVSGNTIMGSGSTNGALFLQYNISNITVTGNTISNNTARGIYLGTLFSQANTVLIQNNSIFNNTGGGLENTAAQVVNAQANWWGDASGPGGSGPGTGNSVSTNVDFCPWLDDAPPAGVPTSNTGAVRNTTSNKYFCSIQDAFNDAMDDDTLQIYPGTYVEDIDASTKDLAFRPGASPGCVAINNLTLGAGDALDMEIDGTTPCTGHDQFSVTGTVTLGGADLILSGAYSLGSGDEVILIENDDVDAVVGQFAQGTSISVGPNTYNIDYAGGDGNDVSLTSTCGNDCGPIAFVGNVTINTQAQMNAFVSGGCLYTSVSGNLTINGNDAGDPIVNMCNLSGLLSVGNNLTIRRFNNAANPTNLDDLANLASVGNNLIIGGSVTNANTIFTDINLPALSGTVNAATINNNPNVTNISANLLGAVTNNLTLGGGNTSLVTISFSDLTSVGGTLTCNAGSNSLSSVVFTDLQSVGNNLTVSGNNSTALTTLDFASLQTVGNNLTFDNNDNSDATIDLSSLQMVTGNLNISDVVLGTLTMDALAMVGGNFVVNSNNGLTGLSLAVLTSVEGDFTMNSNPLATSASFPMLATIGVGLTDNFSMNGNVLMMDVDGSLLTNVAGNFTFSNEDAVTDFDVAFPLLSTVGGNFIVSGNNALDQCCVAACQVAVGGSTNINNNLIGGDCQNLAIAQAACSTLIEVTVSPNPNASPGATGVTLDNDGTDGTYPTSGSITVCDQDNNFRVAAISGFTALTPAINSPAFGPLTKFVYSYSASAEINPALGNADLDAVFGTGNTTVISADPTLLTGIEDIRLFNNTLVQGSVVFTIHSFRDSNNNMLDDDACSSSGNPITLTIFVNPEPEVAVTFATKPIGASVADRDICSGTMIDLALGTLFAGTEGVDYEFELSGVRFDNVGDPNAGATQLGYGPLTGGALTIGVLAAPAVNALQETLVNPTANPIRIVYQVGINVLSGPPLCEGPTLNINILVLPAPSASITPDPAAVCVSENLLLNGNPSGGSGIFIAHSWTGPGAASLDDPSIQTPTFNNGTAGTYDLTYEVTDDNGCVGTDDITVTVNELPTMTCPDDQEVCLNDPDFDMTGLSPTPDPAGGSFTGTGVTGNMFSPSSAMVGTHTINYEYTDGNGCTSSCTFDIAVFENPNISITFSPSAICPGEDVTLTFTDNAASGQTFGITADLVDDNGTAVGGFTASGVTTGDMATYTEGVNFDGVVGGFARLENIVVTNETTNCSTTHAPVQVTVNPTPATPTATTLTSEYCAPAASNNDKRIVVQNPGAGNEVIWILTSAPMGSTVFDNSGTQEFGPGVVNDEFRTNSSATGNIMLPILNADATGVGTYVYGTWTFDVYIRNTSTGCESMVATGYQFTANETPAMPSSPSVKEFCEDETLAPPRILEVQSLPDPDLISVWTIGSNPAGYLPGTEFTPGNGDANLFLSGTTRRSIRVEAPAPTGTYEFCVKIRNTVTGCESAELCGFSITKHPLPDVAITVSPSTICAGDDIKLMFVDNAATGNTFGIIADLMDDNGTTVGGFTASGVSSGDMVTYTEGVNFNSVSGGSAALINIVVTDEVTSCITTHLDLGVMVDPLPDVTITFSPSEICPGEDVTLTFTDNAASGQMFSITADLVDDNGTTVGAINFTGVTTGDMGTYTEGVDFDGIVGGFARLENIVVTNETTTCSISHSNVEVTVNPLPDVSITFSPSAICPGEDVTLTFTDNAMTGNMFAVTADLVDDNGTDVGGFSASGVTTGDMATYTEGVNFDGVVGGFARLENIVVTNETTTCSTTHGDVQVTVNPLPVMSCPADLSVCVDDPDVDMTSLAPTPDPTGGTFTGMGVNGNLFSPNVAGVGVHTITYEYTDGNGCTNSCSFDITVDPNPPAPAGTDVKEFCEDETTATPRRLDVQSLDPDLISVWTIGSNPAGYAPGTEFTPGNGDANLFLSGSTRRSIRVEAPAPTGTYEFCVKIRNTVTGCESAELCGFSITKHPLPDVAITFLPSVICPGEDVTLTFTDNAASGQMFSIIADLVDDNGTTVGGFTASGVSSGDMVTYTEGVNFDGDMGGFARLENIVVTNETTNCTVSHANVEVSVNPTPDISITFSPSVICPDEDVTLTFTDNAASGQTFSITADLVDDNGTAVGGFTASGVSSGDMVTYTEGINFDGDMGGFARLENIMVINETTTCSVSHSNIEVTVNPLPDVSISFSPSAICPGEDVTLTFTDNAMTGNMFAVTADLVDDNGTTIGGFTATGVTTGDMATYTEGVNFDGVVGGFARLENIVVTNETTTCTTTHAPVQVTVNPTPATPTANTLTSEYCAPAASNNDKRIVVQNPGAGNEVIWILTSAPVGSTIFDGSGTQEFGSGVVNDEFRTNSSATGNIMLPILNADASGPGIYVYGTWTFDVYIRNISTGCESMVASGYQFTAIENPEVPIGPDVKEFCEDETAATPRRLDVQTLDPNLISVWTIGNNPAGYAPGTEFTPGNGDANLFLSSTTRRSIRVEAPAPTGTYEFCVKIRNTVTGCESAELCGFSITKHPLPDVAISVSPSTICAGGDIKLMFVDNAATGNTFGIIADLMDDNGTTVGGFTASGVSSGDMVTYTEGVNFNSVSGGSAALINIVVTDEVTSCITTHLDLGVMVDPLPDVTITFSPSEICPGEDVTLTFTDNAASGQTFSITADLVDDNGTAVGGFTASGVSSGDMVTYTEGVNFDGDMGGFARLENIVVTNETTTCSVSHSNIEVTVNPLPDISITFSPSEICAAEDVTLTFTDNAASGQTFSITADLVDDNGTAVGGFTASGATTGDMATYTEGINFDGDMGGFARLENIVVTNETTTCSTTHGDVQVTVNPLPIMTCPADLSVCADDADVDLTSLAPTPDPAGGTFTGMGVVGNLFSPNAAGVGIHTVTYAYTDGNGCTNSCTFDITVNENPAVSVAPVVKEFCEDETAAAPRRLDIQSLDPDLISVWIIGNNPAGYASGTEFTPGNGDANLFLSGSTRRSIRVEAPAPTGTYEFCVKIRNTVTGCESAELCGFSITKYPLPDVAITVSPSTICAGEDIKLMFIDNAATGNTFGIIADLMDDNGTTVGGFTASGVSSGDMVTYTEGVDFNSVSGGSAALINIVVSDETTNCSIPHAQVQVTVNPLPDVTITFSPSEICPGEDVTLTFTDNAASGQTFGITADLVDDNGTTVGAINFTGVTTGDMGTYTEGIDFNSVSGGSAALINIVVTNETTTCAIGHGDVEVIVNPFPDVAITLSPSVICAGEDIKLMFVDNAATGNTFSIVADLVDDNGTTIGGFTASGVSSGDMVTYTEGVNFDGDVGGFARLENIVVNNETTTCNITHTDVEVIVNPLPIMTCPADLSVCVDDADIDLTSLAPTPDPAGGTFTGMGVMGNLFSPIAAGVGVHTVTYEYTDGNGCTNSCTFDITVNENPAVSVAPVVKEFCEDETAAAPRRLDVQSLDPDLISVWTIGNNPAGYAPGTEFTPGNGDANLFLSNTTRRSIRVEAPAPTGTYEFCVRIRNTVTGCEGAELCGFSITKHALPDVSIALSPTEICVGGTVMLTFTDNAATGHLFTITGDLVDDNGTTVGALNETGVPSGASDTYTEGVDFIRATGGTASLTNVMVMDETTNCTYSLPQIDLFVYPDPIAPVIEKDPNVPTVCEGDLLTVIVTTPGSEGIGTCVDEYRFSTDNGANWSTWSTTLPSFNAVVGAANLVESRRNCDGNGCAGNVEQVSWDVNEPIASLMITADPDGDLCIGTTGVQYEAVVVGGTGPLSFAWCAYNNGTGAGTCFNGFNNNAIQNPTRNWTTSAGPKSVGVTVSQAGCPDMTDLYAFNVVADPVAPTIVRNPDNDVCEGETITVDATPGTGGTGTCVDEYRFSTDNGANWSTWSTTVPVFVAVEGVNLVESKRTCTGPDCNPNTNQVAWIVNPRPALQAELNGVAVTDNNDGVDDTGTFEVCDGVPGNVSVTTGFSELNGVGGTIRVYQTVTPDANTTFAPWCNNCQATVGAFVAGTSATATLIDPTMPGSVVITFQVWADANNNGIVDPLECTGDLVEYTVTVNPNPVNTFRAAGTVVTSPFNETLDFDADHATCVGGIYEYGTQAIAGGVNTVAWSISGGGNILQGANSRNVQVEWTTPGVHTLTFVVTHIATGCTSTNSLDVTVNPNPSDAFRPAGTAVVFPFNETLDFDDDHTACIGDVFEYGTQENTVMGTSVLWTLSGGGNILQGGTSRNVQVEWTTPGTYTLTFVFTFTITGCTSTNSIEVIVIPNPVVTCPPNVTVECSDSFDPADTGEPSGTTTICCTTLPTYSKVDIIFPGICADTYTIDREFTVEYTCGYTTTCNQTITVEDTTDPMISCPANVTIECSDDPSPANTGMATGTDNCDLDVTIGSSDATTPGACLDSYIITRTWTAEDNCGHSVSCDQTITVEDTTDPMISCPANVTIECSDDPSPANTGMATGTDNCDMDVTIGSSDAITPGVCLDSYTITRTWTVEDNCGHSVSCDQTITVQDTTDPMISCPANLTVECSDDLTPANTGMATGTDNCDMDVAIGSSDAIIPGACPDSYTITRTWTAEDNCGHSVSCDQTIIVEDTQGPVMQCNDISITPNGNGSYTLSQADLNAMGAGTTDNCGTVTFTASQTFFICSDEGPNTVTLTGTDECGHSSTCDATVTVNPYLTIISCTAIDETCAGAGDGQIVIVATSLGGQIGYSVDGGINFQLNGVFNNLSTGVYNIVVKVFGIPNICLKTDTKTINIGGAITTWYKDIDGDGYTDGITQISCTQPTGYIENPLPGTDCNDGNVDVYPGAPEICDGLDNNCDGTTPASEADADGDGYRICDGDCNDNPNSGGNIHPGATEVCDGLDNNCDGSIDEGQAGETYVGNIIFNTQEALDAWPSCFSVIQGSVNIVGSNITNLGPLSNITDITGNLSIYFNSALFTLSGLDNIGSIGGSLLMYYNFQLVDCCAIDDLLTNDVPPNNSIGGPVVIFYNNASSHCNNAAAIMAACPLSPLVAGPNSAITTGESVTLQEGKKMELYPNPASQEVNVLFDRTSPTATLRIMDMLGRVVYEKVVGEGMDRLSIDLGNGVFDNGIYLVSLLEDGVLTTKQLVVQK